MGFNTDRPLNRIKIQDTTILDIDANSGWTITDIWFDHDIPVEKIDCIKVKFERVKGDRPDHCDTCKDWICEWCSYGQPKEGE